MDEQWSVVLGAVIALTGSALIPWLREGLASRSKSRRERVAARQSAAAELLAANAAVGFADAFENGEAFQAAIERRARAASQLLIATAADEREDLALLLEKSVPLRRLNGATGHPPRVRMYALQGVLASWVAGDTPGSGLIADYNERVVDASRHLAGD